MSTGPIADQDDRPEHYQGLIDVEGQKYNFGTGGLGHHSSIPYGVYPITPDTIGPWGRAHGALGINNDKIYDPKHKVWRGGIELHAWAGTLISEGCVAIAQSQWSQFKAHVLGMIRKYGTVYLHIGPDGASITNSATGA